MKKFKVFISSVLKELLNERLAVQETITEGAVLSRYFEVEMWEEFPPMSLSSRDAYIEKLKESDIYIGLFGNEYGTSEEDGFSPTERQKQKESIFSFSLKVKQMKGDMKNLKDC